MISQADLVAAVLWLGVTIYAVFGGADFGAGLWDLLAGDAQRGEQPRDLIDASIGPVWEANHTWLIFDLVILWSAFPLAFASLMSTLYIPLTLAAFGIILRGAGFAFRKYTRRLAARRAFGATFALSSVITPFFLGAALGGIASGRVPAGNAAGDPWTSWINPTSLLVGALAVAAGAYVAAVFLVAAARRRHDVELERYFRTRALAMGIVAGGLALAGIAVLHGDAPALSSGLTGRALPLVIASVLLGSASLVLLARGAGRGIRVVAAGAVTAIVWGWGVAQLPAILPGSLTIDAAAAPAGTLDALIVISAVAAVTIGPSLALLFFLDGRSRLEARH
ncbi:MAG TPA: cytochrome d ubiquinol oxidase subunit II [Candidatus Limnocylindrales bacterium]|nr:cytochrome d ubiquinol oxidase subunit II [Candidatus Limnocylindrales bacterium]